MTPPADSDDARLLAQIKRRRNDPEFMDRVRQMIEDDRDVLERLAEGEQLAMPRNDSGPTRWTLYEHAGGRMWSTEQIDLWKRPVEVIAVDALSSDKAFRAAEDVLRAQLGEPDYEECYADLYDAIRAAVVDALPGTERSLSQTDEPVT